MKASASPLGKFNNSRWSILLLFIFSVINIFSISTSGTYFLFSAYLPQVFISLALVESSWMVGMIIASIIYILPYLFCYIFSKKKVGWMIAALALFSVDSLFFLIDLPAHLAAGDRSFIIDLFFRVYVLGSLIIGVINGRHVREVLNADGTQENEGNEGVNQEIEAEGDVDFYDTTRQLTIHRKKKVLGCAVAILVYVNGKEVGKLKNGQTETFTVPARSFHLKVAFGLFDNSIKIAAGDSPIAYGVVPKMEFTATRLELTPVK